MKTRLMRFVLGSLVCVGHGRHLPVSIEQLQDVPQAEAQKSSPLLGSLHDIGLTTKVNNWNEQLQTTGTFNPLREIATLLLSLNPASAFVLPGFVAGDGRHLQASRQPLRFCTGASMLGRVYDVAIIGGGPVGVSAAIKASSLGKKAILVDGTPPQQVQFTGPTGLFSKALRDASQRIDVKVLRNMGIGDLAIWAQVNELIQSIVRKCGEDNVALLKRSRVINLRGIGRVVSADGDLCNVQVDYVKSGGGSEKITCRKVLLATGSRAVRLPFLGDIYEHQPPRPLRVFDSDSIKRLSFLPRSVAIVGGGIIAVEFARIFAALSARVTMIIRAKDLPSSLARVGIDRDIGLELQRDLQSVGVKLLFEHEVLSAEYPEEGRGKKNGKDEAKSKALQISLKKTKGEFDMQLRADILFTATGRSACSKDLGICDMVGEGALAKNGDLITGADLRTCLPNVYAAGDLIGAPQLASTGIKQAESAILAMFNENKDSKEGCSSRELLSDSARYPVGIWTIPEVAFVGLTKEAAIERGLSVVEGVAGYADSIRGHVHGHSATGGSRQLKLVVDRKRPHTVIGVHIFGDDACELIHYGTTLVQGGKTLLDTLALTYTAVTFHELFRLAAQDALDIIERDEWRRVFETAVGEDVKVSPEVVTARLLAAGADGDGAEQVAELFRRRRYRAVDDFVKFATRWSNSDGILPEEERSLVGAAPC